MQTTSGNDPDGSVELYDALTCITHARNFIGNKPGLLLMAMFRSYGKSRIEIAFVFPSVDGSYKERKARGEIVPRNRWIDKLNTRSAQNALRPDGKEFYVDSEMEFYVRCNSGHTRQVEIQSFGRPLYSEQKEPHHDEPDYDLPTESIPPSPHPSRSEAPHEDEGTAQPKHRMRRPAPPSIEEERRKSSRSRRSPSHSCSMQPMEISSTASWSTGSNLGNPSQTLRGDCTSTWHASMTSSSTTMSQKPYGCHQSQRVRAVDLLQRLQLLPPIEYLREHQIDVESVSKQIQQAEQLRDVRASANTRLFLGHEIQLVPTWMPDLFISRIKPLLMVRQSTPSDL